MIRSLWIIVCLQIWAMTSLYARDYTHEVFSSIQLNRSFGSMKDGESDTRNSHYVVNKVDLSYGYFIDDHLEPFIGLGYKQVLSVVSPYEELRNTQNLSLGFLYNFPVPEIRPPNAEPFIESAKTPTLSYAQYIPYGGFAVSRSLVYKKETPESTATGDLSEIEVNDSLFVTQLILGLRYMIFPYVGFNFSFYVSYQENSSKSVTNSESKGKFSKIDLDVNLFKFTILF